MNVKILIEKKRNCRYYKKNITVANIGFCNKNLLTVLKTKHPDKKRGLRMYLKRDKQLRQKDSRINSNTQRNV